MVKLEMGKYERLNQRGKELYTASRKMVDELGMEAALASKERREWDMEGDCINHFFECETYDTYEKIVAFAKENEIPRIVDLGAAYGHQSECALNEGLNYLGVDNGVQSFWNADKFKYVTARYPTPLPLEKGDLGVSVLCLTWTCYLSEGDKTLHEQCAALAKDFEHCVLYLAKAGKEAMAQYFETVTKLDDCLYYFSNKPF